MAIADLFSSPQLYTFDSRDPEASFNVQPGEIADEGEIIEVDVTTNEEYSFEFEVSENPVEDGININDHKRAKARVLRMSGIVTDSPNNALDVLQGNLSGTLGASRDDAGNETGTRTQDAYQRLIAMATRAQPIRVVTHLDVFQNMTFTSFRVNKDDAGRYLSFNATLIEVRFAQPEFGTFDADVEHTAPPAASALKEPPVLDNSSILRAAEEAGDAAIANTPGGVLQKAVSGFKAAVRAGLNIMGGD